MHRKSFAKRLSFLFVVLVWLVSCNPPDPDPGVTNPSWKRADLIGLTKVSLEWTTVPNVDSYTLERKQGSGSYSNIFSGNATTREDSVTEGQTYTYRIKSVKGGVSSTGVEKTVTVPTRGTPQALTTLTTAEAWFSKVTTDGNPSTTTNAPTNVTKSNTDLIMNGTGEALYYLGGNCSIFNATVSGAGFKVFADDKQLWPAAGAASSGSTGDLAVAGKQLLSLVFQGTGTGTWTNPTVYCESVPTAPNQKAISGQWLTEFSWGGASPIVPTHAANLPDGRIATWASWKELTYGDKAEPTDECPTGAEGFCEETEGFVWNYKDNSFQESDNPTHDMFCAGLAILPDGRVFGGGGGSFDSPGTGLPASSQRRTSYFDFRTNAWAEGTDGNMELAHWYGTAVAMPDSRIFMVGGASGNFTAEILNRPDNGTWNGLSEAEGASNNVIGLYAQAGDVVIPNPVAGATAEQVAFARQFELDEVGQWYPFLNVAPDGTLFQSGPIPRLRNVTLNGSSSLAVANTPGDEVPASHAQMRTFGNSIMFNEGKLLVTGGSRVRGAGAAKTAMVMDINGAAVEVTPVPDMRFARTHHNGVILSTGDVLVVGGNNSGKQFLDTGYRPTLNPTNANDRWPTDLATESVLTPEVYNPAKNTWRDLGDMTVPRNYHSVGILLEDGTVLAAGGGLCGDAGTGDPPSPTGPSCNHPNGQVFEPPYLFRADGSKAPRPVIGGLTGVTSDGSSLNIPKVGYNKQFTVAMNNLGEGASISRFTMIKLSSVTHSINTDVRFLEVSFTGSDKTYTLTTDDKNTVLTPGYYFLFAINDKGVPSVAKVVQVNQ